MRAYQLYPNGPWIDLDAIQEIDPPRFVNHMGYGGYFITLNLRFAFQDNHREFNWKQDEGGDGYFDGPVLVDGEASKLVEVRRDIYEPLLAAWKAT